MLYGLTDQDLDVILKSIAQFPDIEECILFGSRAKGNFKRGSDVDLALKGTKITSQTVSMLSDLLNEVEPLPYFFDILHYESTNNQELKEHIDRVGKYLLKK